MPKCALHVWELNLPSRLHEPESPSSPRRAGQTYGQGLAQGGVLRGREDQLEPGQAGARKPVQGESPDLGGGMHLLCKSWTS